MDFFKSVFADDEPSEDSPISTSPSTTTTPTTITAAASVAEAAAENEPDHQRVKADPTPSPNSPAWSFGGLIKTLASKSEFVIETYRRDFKEFGSGLKKEATVIGEAVEIGATVAQESLETVGQAIDDIGASVWKSTAEIISHGRNNLLPPLSDHAFDKRLSVSSSGGGLDANKPYSRFEAQLRALQRDEVTYCAEPEDKEEYEKWREGFVFDEKEREIEDLSNENGIVADIYRRVVPGRVADGEAFWSRYFYKVHKLRQTEDARARLVKRAMEGQGEEDLRWDFDDDEEEEEEESKGSSLIRRKNGDLEAGKKGNSSESETMTNEGNDGKLEEEEEDEEERGGDGKAEVVVVVEGKVYNSESSCKDSDVSIVSSQPSMAEEEDLGWDEIEDTGSNYETSKREAVGSSSKADLRKPLSAAEDEEDLGWDIEDEDDNNSNSSKNNVPVKS